MSYLNICVYSLEAPSRAYLLRVPWNGGAEPGGRGGGACLLLGLRTVCPPLMQGLQVDNF